MVKPAKRRVVFIASYLPRKCGIATFTSDLIANTAAAAGKKEFEPLVVAMRSDNEVAYGNHDDPLRVGGSDGEDA